VTLRHPIARILPFDKAKVTLEKKETIVKKKIIKEGARRPPTGEILLNIRSIETYLPSRFRSVKKRIFMEGSLFSTKRASILAKKGRKKNEKRR
jgi:hypothetical protein